MADTTMSKARAFIVDDDELGRRMLHSLPCSQYRNQMTIRVRRRTFSIDVNDIAWIQGASQYSRLHTKCSEYLLSRTLAALAAELDPTRFFRIHRSAIVNVAHVREVRSRGDGCYNVYLHGGLALPMGRARRECALTLLNRAVTSHLHQCRLREPASTDHNTDTPINVGDVC